jgi:hypothetical protein
MDAKVKVAPPDKRAILVPLVIGVTGHRDLRAGDIEKLANKTSKVLRQLREQYPYTPFIIFSALAEGADRLVAKTALDLGAELVVPLPMPQELYEKDFLTPESIAEFRLLLSRAKRKFIVPMLNGDEKVARCAVARNMQYEQMGRCIAIESQILIALWDGSVSEKPGGTWEVVQFQLHGIRNTGRDLEPPERFPVYQIVTPRKSNPYPEGEPFQLIKHYPSGFIAEETSEEYYDQIFHNLDSFNKSLTKNGDRLQQGVLKSKRDLLAGLSEHKLSARAREELDRYSYADALAQLFQRRMLVMHAGLHWLVFLSFFLMILFAHRETHEATLAACSLVLLGAAYLWQKPANRLQLDIKSQDYRAVAEGCRVRLFWRMAGIPDSVADVYFGKQRSELDWIRNGLRGWGLGIDMVQSTNSVPSKEDLITVQRLWVEDQIKYFHGGWKKNEEQLEYLEGLVRTCVQLVVLIGLTVAGIAVFKQWHSGSNEQNYAWIAGPIIALDFFLGAGALLHHASRQRAYEQHAKQFRRMESIYRKAHMVLNESLKGLDIPCAQDCLRQLGHEALLENADWVLLHRERPLEIPHP